MNKAGKIGGMKKMCRKRRRKAIRKAAALLLAVSYWCNGHAQQAPRPADVPVVIIMADQLRFDALGRFTPHIDSLRADGVSFNRVYCASPLCAPSRGAFFTGRYPNRNGCLINGWNGADEHYKYVKAGVPDLYRLMSPYWDVFQIGKQHFFTADHIDKDPRVKVTWVTQDDYNQWMKTTGVKKPGGREFTALVPELVSAEHTHVRRYTVPVYKPYAPGLSYFHDDYFARRSVDAVGSVSAKPLMLITTFLSPHPPFHIPEPYYSRVHPGDLSVPADVGTWYPGQSPLQLYQLTGFIGTRYSRAQWMDIWTKYFGLVNLLDDEVGKIMDALKAKGLYDRALIIFTADHGEMLGSHSLWMKNCMYEASARVPLVIKFPKSFRPAIRESGDLVSLIDVWPTLMDYLHIPGSDSTDGISLMPLLRGQALSRKRVFIQYDGNSSYGGNQRSVVEGDLKLIIDTFEGQVYLELYNEKTDPLESVNLALDPAYELATKRLISEIRGFMKQTRDLLHLPDDIYEAFMNAYHDVNPSL